jgi:hypothetical protein
MNEIRVFTVFRFPRASGLLMSFTKNCSHLEFTAAALFSPHQGKKSWAARQDPIGAKAQTKMQLCLSAHTNWNQP